MTARDVTGSVSLPQVPFAVVSLVRNRQLTVAAAGVAYYVFNALLPTLVLVVLALSASGDVGVAAERVAAFADVPQGSVDVVATAVQDGEGVGRLAALAGGVAAWSALSLSRAMADVFAAVYGDVDHTMLERAADVVVVFLTWVGAVLLLLLAGVALAVVEPTARVAVGWPFALFVGLVVVFLPTYLVFPPSVTMREALPGTAFAAAVWTLSAVLFRAYAATAASVRLFGVVGVLLLVLTWLYVGSLALVAGAATNAVLADR